MNRPLCLCGCGQNLSRKRTPQQRYIHGHNSRGSSHPRWGGGRKIHAGYVVVHAPDHARADSLGYVREHLLIAEKALGKPLPPRAVVHHVNGDPSDNRSKNLVVCEDQAFHLLLHQRQRALEACGNPNWRKCVFCKSYDAPTNMRSGKSFNYHLACRRDYRRGLVDREQDTRDELRAS